MTYMSTELVITASPMPIDSYRTIERDDIHALCLGQRGS